MRLITKTCRKIEEVLMVGGEKESFDFFEVRVLLLFSIRCAVKHVRLKQMIDVSTNRGTSLSATKIFVIRFLLYYSSFS